MCTYPSTTLIHPESKVKITEPKSQAMDCDRVTLYGILSQFQCITSIEIVADNPRSSCPRQTPSTTPREDACRWSTSPSVSRNNSMENINGLGLPKRPSQQHFNVIMEEALEISQELEQDIMSHNFIDDDNIDEYSVDLVSDPSLNSCGTGPHFQDSEEEWSDSFHSDDGDPGDPTRRFKDTKPSVEDTSSRSKDAATSTTLIATIERLAMKAAITLSQKSVGPKFSRDKESTENIE